WGVPIMAEDAASWTFKWAAGSLREVRRQGDPPTAPESAILARFVLRHPALQSHADRLVVQRHLGPDPSPHLLVQAVGHAAGPRDAQLFMQCRQGFLGIREQFLV